jgi:hypothetical protein
MRVLPAGKRSETAVLGDPEELLAGAKQGCMVVEKLAPLGVHQLVPAADG